MQKVLEKKPELKRAIKLPHATAMVVGIIIGASIFVQPSEITGQVPSVGGVFLVRFSALATLPLNDPEASVLELERAFSELGFRGVVEKYPKIRWKLGHLGGAIPYLAERLDRGYAAFKECRANISQKPSEYLKTFYFDTVNFDVKALQLAIDFAGADHLVAGSDYPHQIGSLKQMISSIDNLNISEKDKDNIYGKTAAKLLNI